jgi:hypothetical protein
MWVHVKRETFLPLDRAREDLFLKHAGLVDVNPDLLDEQFLKSLDGQILKTIIGMMSYFSESRSVEKRWELESPANLQDVRFLEAKFMSAGKSWFKPETEYPELKKFDDGQTFTKKLEDKVKQLQNNRNKILASLEKNSQGK